VIGRDEEIATRPSRSSALPAPIRVCISSMNRMIAPSADGDLLQLRLSAAPRTRRDIRGPRSARRVRATAALVLRLSGTSPLTMRNAGLDDRGLRRRAAISTGLSGAARQH